LVQQSILLPHQMRVL